MAGKDRTSHGTRIGRLGELLTTFTLEKNGIQAALVDREEIDIWVRTASGQMKTVQVKTCSAPVRDRDRPLRYRFTVERGTTADLYALVALDRGLVVFYPTTARGLGHINPESFTEDAQARSMTRYLA